MNLTTRDASAFDSGESGAPGLPLPVLVSFHFLRAALRRSRAICLLFALLGLLVAGAYLVAVPAPHQATATLLLAHDPQLDPSRAMATDVSLASTRTVAQRTITTLGLPMAPDDLLKTVTAVPVTSDLLVLTLSAPQNDEAVRRLTALTSAYLAFRGTQLSAQSDVLVGGMNQRITALQAQVTNLTGKIDNLTATGDTGTGQLTDDVTQRAQLSSQITSLQQSVQDATLRTTSIVSASKVIDAPTAVPAGGRLRLALTLLSGLIGGGVLGAGVVLFRAITTDRLVRRAEVATALEAPVPVSVGRLTPRSAAARRLPLTRAGDARRAHDRQVLAHSIANAVPRASGGQRLAVACIDNADELRFGLVAAAVALQLRGQTVHLIDLTEQGRLDSALTELLYLFARDQPTVSRPRVIPSLARGLADLYTVGPGVEDAQVPALSLTDVVLVLADLDPAVGVDHLTAWTERVMVAVTSGRSSAERVRTAGDLVRAAGLTLTGGVLVRADVADASSGIALTAGVATTRGRELA